MGQEESKPQSNPTSDNELTLKRLSVKCLNKFEINSLNITLNAIQKGETSLTEALGIQQLLGAPLLLRIANNLAFGDLESNLSIAITWLNGRLRDQLNIDNIHWQKQIFDAASITNMGNEYFMTYSDFRDFIWILFSAFDWDYRNFDTIQIIPLEQSEIERITHKFKAPAIRFDLFSQFFAIYPYALAPLREIWNRLLVDKHTTNLRNQKCRHLNQNILNQLKRSDQAILCGILGPQIENTKLMFDVHEDGRSWSSFVDKISQIPDSTVIMIEGSTAMKSKPVISDEKSPFHHILPPLNGIESAYTGPINIIVFVSHPWRKKYTTYTSNGQCSVLILRPTVHFITLNQAFFDNNFGFGVGFSVPSSFVSLKKGDACLGFDRNLQSGFYQSDKGQTLDYRFDLEKFMVWQGSIETRE